MRADNLRQVTPPWQFGLAANRREKKLRAAACVGGPFLSWSENRTVVLTIFCALSLRLRRRLKSGIQALSDRTTKTDRKKSDA
jgi:hypothetical protein